MEKVTYLCVHKETNTAMVRQIIEIANAFKGKTIITKKELSAYIHSIDGSATEAGIRQRISRLKKEGTIISVRKGVYALSNRPVYIYPADKFITRLSHLFSTQYSGINYCIWSSAWLYDFTIHQPVQFFYLFETEPDMVEISFNLLKDKGYKAFLNPDEQTMQLYVMGVKDPIVVRSLISRAPLIKNKAIKLPSLEKMLVDAYIDKKLFYFIQGKEIENIYKFSFSLYSINLSRLINYAGRRGIGNEITDFAKRNVQGLNQIF